MRRRELLEVTGYDNKLYFIQEPVTSRIISIRKTLSYTAREHYTLQLSFDICVSIRLSVSVAPAPA